MDVNCPPEAMMLHHVISMGPNPTPGFSSHDDTHENALIEMCVAGEIEGRTRERQQEQYLFLLGLMGLEERDHNNFLQGD